jgi:hypothetical protein
MQRQHFDEFDSKLLYCHPGSTEHILSSRVIFLDGTEQKSEVVGKKVAP